MTDAKILLGGAIDKKGTGDIEDTADVNYLEELTAWGVRRDDE